MEDSILVSIKKLLGMTEEYTPFDTDIIIHINTVFSILTQIGVGSDDGFYITGADETWTDYLPYGARLEMVKTYVYQKVRILFDPPSSSAVMEAMNRSLSELEWRILITVN